MKTFILLASVLAAASAAPQLLVGARPAGQVSHQSVTRPGGEVRRLVQSKAFGSPIGSSSQVDNSKRLTENAQPAAGALRPVAFAHAAPVHVAHAAPVHVAHAAPVHVAHAAPVHVAHAAPLHLAHAAPVHVAHAAPLHVAHAAPVHVAHAAPLHVAHAAPVHVAHAAPVHVAHAAPLVRAVAHPITGYAAQDLPEVSPYNFNYAVSDDYSGSAFTAAETSDGLGVKSGSYKVALPDGRTQTVTYTTDDVNGYVAEVTYEGVPQYPAAPVVVAHTAPVHVAHTAPVHVAHNAPVAVAHPALG